MRSLDSELLARYPEREPVEKEVAGFLGLEPAQVLLTNGVDEAIYLLCSTYLDPGDEALIVVPTFAMYAVLALAQGARVVEVLAGDNFAFPEKDLLTQLSPRTRLIAVANPNNPTGAAVAGDVLIRICLLYTSIRRAATSRKRETDGICPRKFPLPRTPGPRLSLIHICRSRPRWRGRDRSSRYHSHQR